VKPYFSSSTGYWRRLEADHECGGGDGEVLAERHGVAPALQALGDRRGVLDVHHALAGGARGLGEADQQVGVADVGELLLVHVLEEEVLGVGGRVGGVGVDVAEVVGERADVVVVVLRPAGEVVALELAVRPRRGERRVLRLAALDRLLERSAERVAVEELGHFLIGHGSRTLRQRLRRTCVRVVRWWGQDRTPGGKEATNRPPPPE
jgi:hypothetical protein